MLYPSTKAQGVLYFFGLIFILFIFLGYEFNPPNGYTGAPGDGLCTNCHTPGNPNGFDGSISISGLPSTISPGMTYTITLTSMNPNGLASLAGFQMVALDDNNNNAGSMSNNSPNTNIDDSGARTYFEHQPAADFPPSNEVSWNVDWTAPSSLPNGTVITMYAANNIANDSGDPSGDYIVTNQVSGTIMGANPLEVSITQSSDVSCFGGSDGSATAQASGGTPSYTYNWSNGASGSMVTNLTAGTYTVTVTDNAGSTATAMTTISQPSEIVINTSSTDVSCNGGSDGSATANVSGGTSPYNYSWSNGGSGPSINGLAAGIYTLTVTDDNACTSTAMVMINEPAPLTIAPLIVQDVSCAGGSDGLINVEANGGISPYTYAWSNGGSGSGISNLTAGTYSVTVTDDNACTSTASYTIEEPPALMISLTGSQDVSCFGGNDGSATVTAAGGTPPYSFDWSDGATGMTNDGLSAGSYTVTVTDDNNCTNSLDVTIDQPDELTVMITSTNETEPNANDGTATANPGGGTPPYSYSWSNGETTQMIDSLAPGTYTVTVTDDNGCTVMESVTIESVDCPLTLSISTVDSIDCYGGQNGVLQATVMNGPNPQFSWNTGSTDPTISNLGAGTYSVTVTDDNNCTATAEYILVQPDSISIDITTQDETSNNANDGTATANPGGGTPPYSFNWSNGETTQMIDSLAPGTYNVTVTDDNGCTSQASAVINPFGCDLAIGLMQTGEIQCHGDSSAGIDIILMQGGPIHTIEWNTGDTTQSINGLPAGMYSVTVTDTNNCVETASISITQPEALDLSLTVMHETANNANDGSVQVTVSGGSAPYSYLWSNGATTDSIGGLSPGTYTVTVTDDNNCTATATATVNPFGCNLATTGMTTDPLCADSQDGEICLSISGGSPPYSMNWSAGTIVDTCVTDLGAGQYFVTVTDDANCTVMDTFLLEDPDSIMVDVIEITGTDPGESDGSIEIDVSGGTGGYDFEWYIDGELVSTAEDPMNLAGGMYTLEISDQNGCMATFGPYEVPMNVATEDPSREITLEWFPNPAGEWITIRSNSLVNSISISNIQGERILIRRDLRTRENRLSVSSLSDGLYFLGVRWADGTSRVVKLVKQ